MVPPEGTSRNGFSFEMFSTPETRETKLNVTGKLLIFLITNSFSAVSLTRMFVNDSRPSSG